MAGLDCHGEAAHRLLATRPRKNLQAFLLPRRACKPPPVCALGCALALACPWAYAESLPCPSPLCHLQIHDMLHVHPLSTNLITPDNPAAGKPAEGPTPNFWCQPATPRSGHPGAAGGRAVDAELTHHVGPNRTIVACLRNQGKQARMRLKSGAIDSAAPGEHDRALVYSKIPFFNHLY